MMELRFVGMLLGVEQRTSKDKGTKYTVLKFSSVDGKDFSMSADGHVSVGAEFNRRDANWTLGIMPNTYQGVTRFQVTSISADLGKESKKQ